MFDCAALGPLNVKGLSEPVEVWCVRSELPGISRFEALHSLTNIPLVGREEEVEVLLRRWHHSKMGEGRVVLLSGEPGIGKSRIAESFSARLESERHELLRYFCSPYHTQSALYPFISQLERATSSGSSNEHKVRLDKLEALLKPTSRNLERDLALFAGLLGLSVDNCSPTISVTPQQKREMTLTSLLDQLEALSTTKPILVVLEDAHWIDPTSLELLDRTVARVAELPVLLLISMRPEFQPPWIGQPHVTMLSLSRLGHRDAAMIVAGVAKGKALPDAVIKHILERADGVPLFIEELTSTLLESCFINTAPERYLLEGSLPAFAIPRTLQASLVARLDRLGLAKDVAQIGAVIGREFSHELLASVVALDPPDLEAALERLVGSGLVTRRGMPPHAIYSFKHALVQDAAYATLLKSKRQQLHAGIAKALTDRVPKHSEVLPEVVAHHFTQAGLAREAIGCWHKAGQLATARSANQEAVGFFEQALGLLETLPKSASDLELAFEILLEVRQVLNRLGEVRRTLQRLQEAEAIAELLSDDRRRGRVCAFTINIHSLLGELDQALATAARALDLAHRTGDLRIQIPATTFLMQAHFFRGDHERVVELARANIDVLPAEWIYEYFGNGAPASVYDRAWMVMGLTQLGRFVEAAQVETEAMRLAEPTNNPFTIGFTHFAASTLRFVEGDWKAARSLTDRWIKVVQEGNVILLLPIAVSFSTWALAEVGEPNEALNRIVEAENLLERDVTRGLVGRLALGYHALGRAALRLGRLDEAERLGSRAVEASPHQQRFAAEAQHLLGEIASHPDRFDMERAESHYCRSLALAEQRGMRPLVAHCHCGLGRLYLRASEAQQSLEHLDIAKALYSEMGMTRWMERLQEKLVSG